MVRHFVLTRMRGIKVGAATFTPPRDFDVGKHLHGSLGSFAGDQEHEVRVILDAAAAFYAREQPWHPSQTLRELADGNGRVELTIRITDLPGARSLILSHGEHVEVLAPAELRNEILAIHRTALARYEAKSTRI